MVKDKEELQKRMSGVEEMVANLIVDQQAMVKAFQERGDRHSGSLERHRAELNATWREIDRLQVNQSTIVNECSVLRTQVESMGENLCRSGLRKKLLDGFLLIPLLDVGNAVAHQEKGKSLMRENEVYKPMLTLLHIVNSTRVL